MQAKGKIRAFCINFLMTGRLSGRAARASNGRNFSREIYSTSSLLNVPQKILELTLDNVHIFVYF
jgi:hypothetical protein